MIEILEQYTEIFLELNKHQTNISNLLEKIELHHSYPNYKVAMWEMSKAGDLAETHSKEKMIQELETINRDKKVLDRKFNLFKKNHTGTSGMNKEIAKFLYVSNNHAERMKKLMNDLK